MLSVGVPVTLEANNAVGVSPEQIVCELEAVFIVLTTICSLTNMVIVPSDVQLDEEEE